jgi:hypothetical protein
VIEAGKRELLESPCALIVATVDADGLPDGTRGWGLQVLPDGEHVRVLLSSNASRSLDNLGTTGAIAITATHFVTLESVQLKGRLVALEPATDDDRRRFERFCTEAFEEIANVEGTPATIVARMRPPGVVAATVTVESVFDQTPGPAAGARLAPT